MEDENKSGAEGADTAADNAEEQGADDTQADKGENDGGAADEGGSDDKGAGDGADKGGGEDGDGTDKGKSTDKKPTPKADEEPQTRKRNADFIIERKNRKIAKLQDKGAGKDDDKGADEEGDDDVAPEDEEVITKVVQKHLKPIVDRAAAEEDKQEIDSFVAANPDFKPYADKVAKWAKHPSRAGIPIKTLFYEVAGDDLLKIGAERAKKAGDKARETGAGGGANRDGAGGGTKPVAEMTQEEFEAEQNKVRSKQRE